ncbi:MULTISPECIES: hypothetical protein [unclassified Cyanobium]|uniref:hypothetical protein n=1 Tax=unclassified Cyanobium TaxID=2627006 RepID=UPI0020CE33A1|nr:MULTISPECIES: hypothetical protein [unclassified Cyanobium]MCP9860056.1 hypothetical protein [Cyanobium sp. Cruz-8H5]MCP9867231.1 hypothetical protein [Cyanobium sp. Cruz-8D1]
MNKTSLDDLLAKLAFAGFITIAIALAPLGSFVDEDEKIAVGIFAANGMMPYRDVLLNHGPFPFLIGSFGYWAGGSVGSLIALRLVPILLAIATAVVIRSKRLFSSSLSSSRAQALWCVLLGIFWSKGVLRMGLYHGMGGLIACLVLLRVIVPILNNNEKPSRSQLWEFAGLSSLLLSLSATFLPFILLTSLACLLGLAGRRDSLSKAIQSRNSARHSIQTEIIRFMAIAASFSPVFTLLILASLGAITPIGLYLGHLYFNKVVFAKFNPPLPFVPRDFDIHSQLLPALLVLGVVTLPLLINQHTTKAPETESPYPQQRSGFSNSQFQRVCISFFTSSSILSLAYRSGPFNLAEFHSLPYTVPASALVLVGCLRLLEVRRNTILASIESPGSNLKNRAIGIACILPLFLFGLFRYKTQTNKPIGYSMHPVLERMIDGEKNDTNRFLVELISAIESERGIHAKIYSWPFNPDFYAALDRASPYPSTWYLWYHTDIEKDPSLADYRVCNREDTERPSIISYASSANFDKLSGHQSEVYGNCLIKLQNEEYLKLGASTYIHKMHRQLARELLDTWPKKASYMVPLWHSSGTMADQTMYVGVPKNQRIRFKIPARRLTTTDGIHIRIGTYGRSSDGQVTFCVKDRLGTQKACSNALDKSRIVDNAIMAIAIKDSREILNSRQAILTVEDRTSQSSASKSPDIAIYTVINTAKDPVSYRSLALWEHPW